MLKYITKTEDLPTLKYAQDYVGGTVQTIPFRNGDLMLINEEGIYNGAPINYEATSHYKINFGCEEGVILGKVIIIKKNARDGESWWTMVQMTLWIKY